MNGRTAKRVQFYIDHGMDPTEARKSASMDLRYLEAQIINALTGQPPPRPEDYIYRNRLTGRAPT